MPKQPVNLNAESGNSSRFSNLCELSMGENNFLPGMYLNILISDIRVLYVYFTDKPFTLKEYKTMEEYRRAPRLKTALKIVSKCGDYIETQLINLSSGGMFIKAKHLLPVDAQFTLNLQLPEDDEIMAIDSRIVWTKHFAGLSPSGMGVQFIDLLPAYQKKISDFVEKAIGSQEFVQPLKLHL